MPTQSDRCTLEKNKKIFATLGEAEAFEKENREKYVHPQQYAYECPHGDHAHLASSPPYVEGAPRIKTTDWSHVKARWQVTDPEYGTSKNDLIRATLKKYHGSKTAKDIAAECGVSTQAVYDIARKDDLPYLWKRGHLSAAQTKPVVTLQNIKGRREQAEAELKRAEAELKRVDELEQALRKQEEERMRVTVKLAPYEGEQRILVGANGGALWLTTGQAESLLAQLPSAITALTQAIQEAGE
jgi:hypothetical protein